MQTGWSCRKAMGVGLAVFVLSLSGRANDLINPGFEAGDFTSWSQWQPGNTTINNWGHDGSGFSAAGWWQTSGWQDVAIADANAAYNVGGWIYDDVAGNESLRNGSFATIRVEFKDGTDAVIGSWSSPQLTGAVLVDDVWSEFTSQLTPSDFGAGIVKATLVWEVNNIGTGDGRGIFDDLIVETVAIPEPGGFLVMGLGLFGIAVAMSKPQGGIQRFVHKFQARVTKTRSST